MAVLASKCGRASSSFIKKVCHVTTDSSAGMMRLAGTRRRTATMMQNKQGIKSALKANPGFPINLDGPVSGSKETQRQRSYKRGSRMRLNPHHVKNFPGNDLRDAVGREICRSDCLPTKEFFESWELASLICDRFREKLATGSITVVDMAAGHGLTAWMLLIMEPAIRFALCVDVAVPPSSVRLAHGLTNNWTHLAGRVRYVEGRLEQVSPNPQSLLVAIHACGPLTDYVIDLALKARSPLAVMPCCHSARKCDTGGLHAWMPLGHAIDATRVARLQREGYEVVCETIPSDITPENRVILAWPSEWGSPSHAEGHQDHVRDGQPHLVQSDPIWPPLNLMDSPWKRFGKS